MNFINTQATKKVQQTHRWLEIASTWPIKQGPSPVTEQQVNYGLFISLWGSAYCLGLCVAEEKSRDTYSLSVFVSIPLLNW